MKVNSYFKFVRAMILLVLLCTLPFTANATHFTESPSTNNTSQVASIGNKHFASLSSAINMANEGDHIVLLQPRITEDIRITKSVTIEYDNEVVIEGDCYIKSGAKLMIPSNSTLVVTENLTIQCNETGEGQIYCSDGYVTAKNIYLEKFLASNPQPGQYFGLSLPFDVNMSNGITNAATNEVLMQQYHMLIYEWNGQNRANYGYTGTEDSDTNGWQRATSIKAGKAYMIATKGVPTIRIKALSNTFYINNTLTIPVTNFQGAHGDQHNGWNFMAQPVCHNVKAIGFNDDATYGYIQILKGGNAYEPRIVIANNNSIFAPYMAFFYQTDTDRSVMYKGTNDDATIRPMAQQTSSLPLALEVCDAHGQVDRIFLTTSESAPSTYTIGKHLTKMGLAYDQPQIYMKGFSQNLAVQELPLINQEAKVPIHLIFPANGEYTFSLANQGESTVYLMKGETPIANLSQGSFTLSKTNLSGYEINTDFALRIINTPNVSTETVPGKLNLYAFVHANTLYINGLNSGEELSIFDLSGRRIINLNHVKIGEEIALPNKGVFIVSHANTTLKIINQ